MHSWSSPFLPHLPGHPVALSLYDTADGVIKPVDTAHNQAGMYVCGITPYDSTHLGHAATYLTFDLIGRILYDNHIAVHYVQNVTDVDDPLFERAVRDNVDWKELGTEQIERFRNDMIALKIIPPHDYVGVSESVSEVITMITALLEKGAAYVIDDPIYPDIYASVSATEHFGYESHYSRALMDELFAERGGDPQRVGKHDPLDALLWRAHREGEPFWDSPFGQGRPGWHIECSAIATQRLGKHFAIQGGGIDLRFPHHEFSAAHAEAATGSERMANHYVHTGMIGYKGTKMSKSLGNLVFVSELRKQGHSPAAIRLALIAEHYRHSREWTDDLLQHAHQRITQWAHACHYDSSYHVAGEVVQKIRMHLSNDLDTPGALHTLDVWAEETICEYQEKAAHSHDFHASNPEEHAGALIACAIDALLGVKL